MPCAGRVVLPILVTAEHQDVHPLTMVKKFLAGSPDCMASQRMHATCCLQHREEQYEKESDLFF